METKIVTGMTLDEYRNLDEYEQLLIFWMGIKVGEYAGDIYCYECRQLDSFYIELTTDGGSYVKLYPHMDTDRLDPYLDSQDLDVLLFL